MTSAWFDSQNGSECLDFEMVGHADAVGRVIHLFSFPNQNKQSIQKVFKNAKMIAIFAPYDILSLYTLTHMF